MVLCVSVCVRVCLCVCVCECCVYVVLLLLCHGKLLYIRKDKTVTRGGAHTVVSPRPDNPECKKILIIIITNSLLFAIQK